MSRPPTPTHLDPQADSGHRFHPVYSATEWCESYHPGGFHPVHLGEVYHQRYEVYRKLGYGSYSTVWLAFDQCQNRFVAIKFMTARSSQGIVQHELSFYKGLRACDEAGHVVALEDSFETLGPNGRHICLVFKPMGPHLSEYIRRSPHLRYGDFFESRLPIKLAKQVLREVLVGLRELHHCGIVHGDLHQGNILVNIPMDSPKRQERESVRQAPDRGRPLQRLDGKRDLWSPTYLLTPSPLLEFVSMDLVPFVQLSDLGSAFSKDSPPEKMVTPSYLRSPELILGLQLGVAVDIWSFGCFMFQLLAGSSLFIVEALEGDPSDEETNDEHLIQISEVLSPLPDNLFQHWRRGREYFDTDGTRLRIKEKEDPYTSDSDSEAEPNYSTPKGTVELNDESTDGTAPLANAPVFETLEQLLQRKVIYDLNGSEQKDVASLIRWILQVDASQRPSADEILKHPWFA